MTSKLEVYKGPWSTLATVGFLFVIALVMGIVQVAFMIAYIFGKTINNPNTDYDAFLEGAFQTDGFFMSLSVILAGFAAIGTVIFIVRQRKGLSIRDYLALKRVPLLAIPFWLLAAIAVGILLDVVMHIFGEPAVSDWQIDIYKSAASLPLLIFSFSLVAPIYEELIFRGFFYEGIRHSRIGNMGAIIVVSIIWALLHIQYQWFYILQIFVFGILLGIARMRTNSLVPAISMHIALNGISTYQTAMMV